MASARRSAKFSLRESASLGGLFLAGAVAVAGYNYFTRHPTTAAPNEAPAFRTASAGKRSPDVRVRAVDSSAPSGAAATGNAEAEKRVEAIEALSKAPPGKAVPALQAVINRPAEEPEWRAALRTLGTLAQTQGDPDDTIRNGLREVIAHTSNEALILGAQDTLDEIDRAAFEAATGRPATADAMRGAEPPEGTPPDPPPSDE